MKRRKLRIVDPHYLGEDFIQGTSSAVSATDVRADGGHSVNLEIGRSGRYRLTCNDCSYTENGTWPQGATR